jgi:predicted  nucleic acid-binding Zn ribbon protein
MADRKRLVQSKSFFYYVCDVHGWDYDPSEQGDCCPVCQGEQAERKRIKEIIEQQAFHYGKTHYEGGNCTVCRIYEHIGD